MKKLGLNDILETQRCIIKLPKQSEAEYMWSLITENTTKYMIWNKWLDSRETLKNIKKTQEKAEKWESWEWAIYDKKTWVCIGRCGINEIDSIIPSFQLGYWIAEPFWNEGYATEAVGAILKFGFETLGLNKVIAVYLPTNEASGKVMIKNGMIKEAEFKNHDVKRGHTKDDNVYVSLIQYRLMKSEYETLK